LHTFRQRFVALRFDYPPPELKTRIVQQETAIDAALASS